MIEVKFPDDSVKKISDAMWELAHGCTFTGDFSGYGQHCEDASILIAYLSTQLSEAQTREDKAWNDAIEAAMTRMEVLEKQDKRFTKRVMDRIINSLSALTRPTTPAVLETVKDKSNG